MNLNTKRNLLTYIKKLMPNSFTQQERQALLITLGLGRSSAIVSKRLAQQLGYPTSSNQPLLRELIKECIEIDGDLIGATTGKPAGFFRINTLQELEKYVDTLEGRTRSDNSRRSALITSWNNTHNAAITNRNILQIT